MMMLQNKLLVKFVDKSRNVGAITQADLQEYKEKIGALGHTFKTDMEVKRIDENVGKKTSWTTSQVVGENTYYSVYTEAIEAQVNGPSGKFTLKEGDIFSVSSVNTDVTIAQSLRNVFYAIAGKGTYQIAQILNREKILTPGLQIELAVADINTIR